MGCTVKGLPRVKHNLTIKQQQQQLGRHTIGSESGSLGPTPHLMGEVGVVEGAASQVKLGMVLMVSDTQPRECALKTTPFKGFMSLRPVDPQTLQDVASWQFLSGTHWPAPCLPHAFKPS